MSTNTKKSKSSEETLEKLRAFINVWRVHSMRMVISGKSLTDGT